MKILSCSQQKEADAFTIAHDSISSINLMEKAAGLITEAISRRWDTGHRMIVFAGPGNNGGDALAVARMLFLKKYEVEVYLFNVTGKLSEDCLINIHRLDDCQFPNYHEVTKTFTFPALQDTDVVIDGLFGSGLDKPLGSGFASVVQSINASPATVVSIDIPSGLMGEDNSYNIRRNIVQADFTLAIQLPKLSFFFADNEEFVGQWELLDIGISPAYINEAATRYFVTEAAEMRRLVKPRRRFAHKGEFGHALLIAGSYGMAGASVMAAKACLRSGVGLLSVHVPVCNHAIVQEAVPEAIVQDDVDERIYSCPVDLDAFQAVGIGPGLGQEEDTVRTIIEQATACDIPLVLDADAINAFSRHRESLEHLPSDTVLTPHVGELERLIGRCGSGYERLAKTRDLASDLQCYIVLKGAWTTVVTPEGNCYFNPTGNPGMATAGSGDVLTGVLTALLARGYETGEACRLAVYVHGRAGDIARDRKGEISMTASDIIEALPDAWSELSKGNRDWNFLDK